MIRIDRPFILYARCSIDYDGRARSTLKTGNYLIIRKGDGALIIHGATKMVPLNYQPPGAVMRISEGNLISTRKQETIKVNIETILSFIEINDWANNSIDITKTENDLRNRIIDHLDDLVEDKISEAISEFHTPYGPVDILAVGTHNYHVIEIKRSKAAVSACTQLLRYLDYFNAINQPSIGWIMAPNISKGAAALAQEKNLRYKQVTHHP